MPLFGAILFTILSLLVQSSLILAATPTSIWSTRMRGAISEMSISRNGRVVLVATYPDRDIEGSANQNLLSRVELSGSGSGGKVAWEMVMKSPVKEIDLSEDGALAVISNYGNELFALNARKEKVWSVEAMCKPQFLNSVQKILCYHDDDNDPQVAFDIYDWKGKKLLSFPIQRDVLALKVSQDERNLVVGLADGQLILVGPDFKPVWEKKVAGEIADVSVSSGENPVVAVIYHGKKKGSEKIQAEELTLFDSKGEVLSMAKPSFRAVQVEMDPQGSSVFYYGNNSGDGQRVAGLNVKGSQEGWKQGGDFPSEFSYSISVWKSQIFMGFEEIGDKGRTSNLLAFQYDGKMKWKLPFARDESAYLYTHRFAPRAMVLAVGTDDGRLSAYQLKD